MLILYFDGLCEPQNPGGWVCYGWVLQDGDRVVASGRGVARGPGPDSTNNVAEYAALIAGLEALARLDLGAQGVEVRGDSQLVIHQVSGEWQCRSDPCSGGPGPWRTACR
jgi:ribonuclease HI